MSARTIAVLGVVLAHVMGCGGAVTVDDAAMSVDAEASGPVALRVGEWIELGPPPHAVTRVTTLNAFEAAERAIVLAGTARYPGGDVVEVSPLRVLVLREGTSVGAATEIASLGAPGALALAHERGWVVGSPASRRVAFVDDSGSAPIVVAELGAVWVSGVATSSGATIVLRASSPSGGEPDASALDHVFLQDVSFAGERGAIRRLTDAPLDLWSALVAEHHVVVFASDRVLRFDRATAMLLRDDARGPAPRPEAIASIGDHVGMLAREGFTSWTFAVAAPDGTFTPEAPLPSCEGLASLAAEGSTFVVRCTSVTSEMHELRFQTDGASASTATRPGRDETPPFVVTPSGRLLVRGEDDLGFGEGPALVVTDLWLGGSTFAPLPMPDDSVLPDVRLATSPSLDGVVVQASAVGVGARLWDVSPESRPRVLGETTDAASRPFLTPAGAMLFESTHLGSRLSRATTEGLEPLVELSCCGGTTSILLDLAWLPRAAFLSYGDEGATPFAVDRLETATWTTTRLEPGPLGAATTDDDGLVLEWSLGSRAQVLRVRDDSGAVIATTSLDAYRLVSAWSCGTACWQLLACTSSTSARPIELRLADGAFSTRPLPAELPCQRELAAMDGGRAFLRVTGGLERRDLRVELFDGEGRAVAEHTPFDDASVLATGAGLRVWEVHRPVGVMQLEHSALRVRPIDLELPR